jgi:hypothetical protein
MKKLFLLLVAVIALALLTSCSENYSNGDRVGYVTKFSEKGMWFKSYEGELNLSQTGMNSSGTFQFSIDNDNEPKGLVKLIDSIAKTGDKVKLTYHEVKGFNWWNNRGHTDYFVTKCEVLSPGDKPVTQ